MAASSARRRPPLSASASLTRAKNTHFQQKLGEGTLAQPLSEKGPLPASLPCLPASPPQKTNVATQVGSRSPSRESPSSKCHDGRSRTKTNTPNLRENPTSGPVPRTKSPASADFPAQWNRQFCNICTWEEPSQNNGSSQQVRPRTKNLEVCTHGHVMKIMFQGFFGVPEESDTL